MESRDGPAHDADKHKRKNRAVEIRPTAVGKIRVDRGCLKLGVGHQYPQHQKSNRPYLQKRGQIVPRTEQQPNRQNRCDKPIQTDGQNDPVAGKQKIRLDRRTLDPPACNRRKQYRNGSDDRSFDDPPFAKPIHVPPNKQRDRNRTGDRECSPRTPADQLIGLLRHPKHRSRRMRIRIRYLDHKRFTSYQLRAVGIQDLRSGWDLISHRARTLSLRHHRRARLDRAACIQSHALSSERLDHHNP